MLSISPAGWAFKQTIFLFGLGSSSNANKELLGPQNIQLNGPTIGSSYVIFGRNGTIPNFDVNAPESSEFAIQVNATQGGLRSGESVSRSMTILGDVNGDGRDDVMIGSPMLSTCYLYLGGGEGLDRMKLSVVIIEGQNMENGRGLGWANAGVGDLNGDGYGDFMISASSGNTTYVVFGRAEFGSSLVLSRMGEGEGVRIVGSRQDVNFGVSVSNAGDFDGDGVGDVMISGFRTSICVIYVVPVNRPIVNLDTDCSTASNRCIMFTAPRSLFSGLSIVGIGDINGDGFSDVAIGSIPYYRGYTTQQTYVVYGRPLLSGGNGLQIDLRNLQTIDGFVVTGGGFMLGAVGDVNGDGLSDLMVINYLAWQGKSNSYILVYPRNMTSSPSQSPSLKPSPSSSPTYGFPTNRPSETPQLANNVTREPTASMKPSRSPTIHPTTRIPSRSPSFRPSISPTTCQPSFLPTKKPIQTLYPSLAPVLPTMVPTMPTSRPTSTPTEPLSEAYEVIHYQTPGTFIVPEGKHNLFIQVNGTITISKQKGSTIYTIIPSPSTIIIEDFDKWDMLDLSKFSNLHSSEDITYSIQPLSLLVSSVQNVILASHSDQDLLETQFIFSEFQSTTKSAPLSSFNFKSTIRSSFFISIAVVLIIALFVTTLVVAPMRKRMQKKLHSDQLMPVLPDNPNHLLNQKNLRKLRMKRRVMPHLSTIKDAENGSGSNSSGSLSSIDSDLLDSGTLSDDLEDHHHSKIGSTLPFFSAFSLSSTSLFHGKEADYPFDDDDNSSHSLDLFDESEEDDDYEINLDHSHDKDLLASSSQHHLSALQQSEFVDSSSLLSSVTDQQMDEEKSLSGLSDTLDDDHVDMEEDDYEDEDDDLLSSLNSSIFLQSDSES